MRDKKSLISSIILFNCYNHLSEKEIAIPVFLPKLQITISLFEKKIKNSNQ